MTATILNILKIILLIIEFPVMYYLFLPLVMVILLWTIKHFRKDKVMDGFAGKHYDFAAVVTAHQQGLFIRPLVHSLLKQTYSNFIIYVVADDIADDFSDLESDRVKILKPNPALHGKTRSIDYAIQHFVRTHDAISVFDADNLIHHRYFEVMNYYFNQGFEAVQGKIKAKNLNTSAARIDAANETYYSFIDKYSREKVGLSSGTWGLGFAVKLELFKKIHFLHYISGFDKVLQTSLIMLTHKIGYANDAIIYDEKTSTNAALITQRAKWLFGYFKFYKMGIRPLLSGITTFNFDRFNFGINHMRPPLVLLFPAALILLVLNFFLSVKLFWTLLAAIVSFLVAFVLIQMRYGYDARVWKSLPQLPKFMIIQMFALFRTKKAAHHTHTPHEVAVDVEEVENMYHEDN